MKKAYKAASWSAPICAFAAAVALTAPGTAAAGTAAAGTAAAGTAAAPSAAQSFPGRLYSVTAVSKRDAWAAGLSSDGSLIVHWDGTAWSEALTGGGYFGSVAHSSARDVWAVGGTNWFSPTQPLAEHWDGSSWTQVPIPSPAGGGYLDGVAATSSRNAWAVGHAGGGPGDGTPSSPLIEHWNGKHWTIQKYPVPAQGGTFGGVAATSPRNAWVVGATNPNSDGAGQQILIEHWNGKQWSQVPSPKLPANSNASLAAVTVVSADDAWAVGQVTVGGSAETVALHWDGRHWKLVPSPTPPTSGSFFGVGASGEDNVWAVGQAGQSAPYQTITAHWNGKRWTLIPSPNPPSGYLNALFSVSAVDGSDIWAAGTTDYASTLILHWNGKSWS